MKVSYHKLVQQDFLRAARYYRRVASDTIAERFEVAFRKCIQKAANHPASFHSVENGLRRANLNRFPWNILFRIRTTDILIVVLRHDKRHPRYGLARE